MLTMCFRKNVGAALRRDIPGTPSPSLADNKWNRGVKPLLQLTFLTKNNVSLPYSNSAF